MRNPITVENQVLQQSQSSGFPCSRSLAGSEILLCALGAIARPDVVRVNLWLPRILLYRCVLRHQGRIRLVSRLEFWWENHEHDPFDEQPQKFQVANDTAVEQQVSSFEFDSASCARQRSVNTWKLPLFASSIAKSPFLARHSRTTGVSFLHRRYRPRNKTVEDRFVTGLRRRRYS